ncbi:phosphonate ABC transporter ATP-binding protein [Roseibacillus ishigakijimensis]|uniref:ATP-binding cassette domain-containing protein n=1 Tax=Roseibacillus ishigakijimensis TaxID=454146 RepID=A0A934RQZ3_9BACT|nr:ATP-binding cassette domain-containing protein [Roseibacillus ishigakijimensis]MBK1832926.1 ATP-binding cassette domain-containing protein [Roseibacillus ishigakijimensis]
MFELRQATLRYGDLPALHPTDLRIAEGEQVCLIGPSGAGKTSLLGLLNGRFLPSAGQVRANGRDLAQLGAKGLRQVRSRLAWVPQDLGLVPNLRVNQNVACGRVAEKGPWGLLRSFLFMKKSEREAIHHLLERLGIGEKLYQRVDQLSGGQQQRVAVARALFQQPSAILADEPVSAIDPERARDLIELLTAVAREEDLTLVASLHDVALARRYFDRIIGLRAGRVVFDGEAEEGLVNQLYRLDDHDNPAS